MTRREDLSLADLIEVRDRLAARLAALTWQAWQPYPWQVCPGVVPTLGMWLLLGGRGTGKSESAARYVIEHIRGPACDQRAPGGHRIAIVAPTLGDAIESCVTGLSGLQAHDRKIRLRTGPGGTHVYFPNGAEGKLFGAYTKEDRERLRAGGNRCLVWLEELAAMRYLGDALTHTAMGLRVGPRPHYVASTTPKPRKELRELAASPDTLITRGRTADAHKLPAAQRRKLLAAYTGTRLGAQELEGKLLDDVEGALWTWDLIHDNRVEKGEVPELLRIVIAADPNASEKESADEFGIVAAARGIDQHIYILDDRSAFVTGEKACRRVWQLWWDLGGTGEVVYEGNKGGIWVGKALKDVWKTMRDEAKFPGSYGHPPIHEVSASEDKATRAVPCAVLYELGRVHHVGVHEKLESEQTSWARDSGDDSPNRLDAAVWAIIRLEQAGGKAGLATPVKTRAGRLPRMPGQPTFRGFGVTGRPGGR